MIKVSTTGMVVSLKTDLRFPIPGQWGHGGRIIHLLLFNALCSIIKILILADYKFGIVKPYIILNVNSMM